MEYEGTAGLLSQHFSVFSAPGAGKPLGLGLFFLQDFYYAASGPTTGGGEHTNKYNKYIPYEQFNSKLYPPPPRKQAFIHEGKSLLYLVDSNVLNALADERFTHFHKYIIIISLYKHCSTTTCIFIYNNVTFIYC